MPDPISITVSESNAMPGASVTVTLASTPVTLYGSSVAVTVANSALASGAGKTIVSSGGIADLTSAQQLEVGEGTIVVTTDGYRYIYSGSGSKTNPASYVILADITPDWSSLSGKPSTFTPSAHAASHASGGADAITVAISQVTGLQTALDGKQASGSYVLTTDSRLTDSREWSAATVTQAEAEAGTSTTRLAYTPQRVFQAVASWWDGSAAKTKLDGIASGATANATDADLRDRTTHTGVQAISTVDGLQDALDGKATSSHFHGNITNNGEIGTASGRIVVTTTGGVLTTTPSISSSLVDGLALVAVTGAYSDLTGTPAAYSLPAATTSTLGGVIVGSGLSVSSGTVSANVTSVAGRTGAVTIAAADVSGLAASATTDATNASNISSGTLAIGRIPTGTTSTTVCIGNDSRLSDSREWSAATVTQAEAEAGTSTSRLAFTPLRVFQAVAAWWAGSAAKTKLDGIATGATANATDAQLRDRSTHTGTQAATTITGLATIATSGSASDLSTGTVAIARIPTGTTSSTVCIGNDSRLSDARTPTAHKASHATGGSDALSPADIGAAASSHTHAASDITSGTVATARLASGSASASTFLRGDQTWSAAPVTSVDGSTGAVTVSKSDVFTFTRSSKPASATGSTPGPYTWTIPTGAKFIDVLAIGGGGGGGSGRRGAAASGRSGGGGGGSAAIIRWSGPVSESNSTTLTITVGAGGAGGAAVTADSTNGNAGSAGGVTTVYSSGGSGIICDGGAAGGGGGTATGSGGGQAGWQSTTQYQGTSGGNGSATAAGDTPGAYLVAGCSGGAGGGGVSSSDVATAGGTGGSASSRINANAIFGRGSAGTAGGGNGGNASLMDGLFPSHGLGGGGGGGNSAGAGGSGGTGIRGGGGGGGGGCVNGSNSGAGGNGGDGYVRITVWY